MSNDPIVQRALEGLAHIGALRENEVLTRPIAPESPHDVGDSPYKEHVQATLRAMCSPDYPGGMVEWLDRAHPDLYHYVELSSRLPSQIDRLWDAHAPLERFKEVLGQLLALHRQCCGLYRKHLLEKAQTEPTATPKTSPDDFGTPQSDRGRM